MAVGKERRRSNSHALRALALKLELHVFLRPTVEAELSRDTTRSGTTAIQPDVMAPDVVGASDSESDTSIRYMRVGEASRYVAQCNVQGSGSADR